VFFAISSMPFLHKAIFKCYLINANFFSAIFNAVSEGSGNLAGVDLAGADLAGVPG